MKKLLDILIPSIPLDARATAFSTASAQIGLRTAVASTLHINFRRTDSKPPRDGSITPAH